MQACHRDKNKKDSLKAHSKLVWYFGHIMLVVIKVLVSTTL